MKKIIGFFRSGEAEAWIGRIAVVLVIVPVIVNIFLRSVVKTYSTPIEALALTAFVWIGYASFGYLYKKDSHVDVRFLVKLLPPKGQVIMSIIRDVFILVFSVYIIVWGVKLTRSGMTRNITGTKISFFYPYVSVVVGYSSGALRSLFSLLRRIIKKRAKGGETV